MRLEFAKGLLAPDSFTTGVDWLLERTVGTGMNGLSFGSHSFSDLDFTVNVALLAEILELLVVHARKEERRQFTLQIFFSIKLTLALPYFTFLC